MREEREAKVGAFGKEEEERDGRKEAALK